MQPIKRVLSLAMFLLACSPALAQVATDEAAIRELATGWEQAWNQHDMKRLVSLVTDDADFVNVGARHWKGRQEIEAEHARRLDQFRESTWVVVEQSGAWLIRAAQNTNRGNLATQPATAK